MQPLKKFDIFFSYEGARPEKGLQIWPFSNKSEWKFWFFNVFKNFFRNKLQTFYTMLICEKNYLTGVPRGPITSQKSKEKINDIQKLFQVGFVTKFFF